MITFNNVSKHYPNGQEALHQVSFELHAGEMVFLTGHSGAGKSTCLKLIALLEPPSAGEITVAQHQFKKVKRGQVPFIRRQMGIIFQTPQLLFDRSVYANVALPLLITGYRSQDIKKRVQAALDKVGLLQKQKRNPQELSIGEQQRVGIARAVVNKPKILLADEPTGNLDPILSEEIMRLFSAFQQLGTTVLIATHDLALIARMPYRILSLQQGVLR